MSDAWDPQQYGRFRSERTQPFLDLVALVKPKPGMRVLDLGCGTGDLTRTLHERLNAASTVGVDDSPAMLEKAAPLADGGLRFERAKIEDAVRRDPGSFDLVFSNSALHWVEDHRRLFERLFTLLAPGGQLAVQMPANDDHPSHATAREVALESPFREDLAGYVRKSPVLPVEDYAALLHRASAEWHVRLQVYGNDLPDRDSVVEWVRGSLLTEYERRLSGSAFERFLDRYRTLLESRLEDARPYFYTYKRVLLSATCPS